MDRRLTMAGLDEPTVKEVDQNAMDLFVDSLREESAIYDAVFDEAIAVVQRDHPTQSQLLSEIRTNYQHMIARIPKQVQVLQHDLDFEKQLNRHLVNELRRTRAEMRRCLGEVEELLAAPLPVELLEPPEEAKEAATDAIKESESATKLIKQLENLYELQRVRLEGEVASLRDSRDEWIGIADHLSQLFGDSSTITTLDGIRRTATSWFGLARRIINGADSRDTTTCAKVDQAIAEWKSHISAINRATSKSRELGVLLARGICRGIMEAAQVMAQPHAAVEQHVRSGHFRRSVSQADKWLTALSKRRNYLVSLSPVGGYGRLEKLCAAWSEYGDNLFKCHNVDDHAPLRKLLHKANELEREAVAKAQKSLALCSAVEFTLARFHDYLKEWRLASKKVVNMEMITEDEFKDHVHGLHELGRTFGQIQKDLDAAEAAVAGDIVVMDWSLAAADWVLRLENDIVIHNRTLSGQVRNVERSFQQWTIAVEMCAGRVEGAHPMDVVSKHHRLFAAVDDITTLVTNSITAVPDLPDGSNGGPAVIDSDLALMRDEATEWNEQSLLLIERLQQLYAQSPRSPTSEPADMAQVSKHAASDVLTTSRAGNIMPIPLPDESKIMELLSSAKSTAVTGTEATRLAAFLQEYVRHEETNSR